MKKRYTPLLLLLSLLLLLGACTTPNAPIPPQNDETTTEEETTTAPCEHNFEEAGRTDAMALRDGKIDYLCTKCGEADSKAIPATKTVRVLALGNSFTVDGMQYLWDICKAGGADTVILGNLYIGSCTLDKHWGNIQSNKAAYTFYKNTDGTWKTTENYRVSDALKEEDWDLFVFHQASSIAGTLSSYANLDHIITYFNQNKTNTNAKIVWHSTWAHQSDSTSDKFANYGYDQMRMYTEVTKMVKDHILPRETIAWMIPSGTAVQNLRTSKLGDRLTRDGYHMSYDKGRYTVALTWYAALTGGDVDSIEWVPQQYQGIKSILKIIKESVNNALNAPFEITQSSFTK